MQSMYSDIWFLDLRARFFLVLFRLGFDKFALGDSFIFYPVDISWRTWFSKELSSKWTSLLFLFGGILLRFLILNFIFTLKH